MRYHLTTYENYCVHDSEGTDVKREGHVSVMRLDHHLDKYKERSHGYF